MAWWAVYTDYAKEEKVREILQKRGTEAFLPVASHRRRVRIPGTKGRKFRIENVEAPLFPHYLFVRPTPGLQAMVRSLDPYFKIGKIVVIGEPDPSEIRDEVVEALRHVRTVASDFQVGSRVKVGPLDDAEAVVTAVTGGGYIVRLNIMGAERTLRLSASSISEGA
jgi:transcription antitermination factor NusG